MLRIEQINLARLSNKLYLYENRFHEVLNSPKCGGQREYRVSNDAKVLARDPTRPVYLFGVAETTFPDPELSSGGVFLISAKA